MLNFKHYSNINEGIYDPNIFKAIWIAGSPASGKTKAAKELGLSGVANSYGLKYVNSDVHFENFMKRANLDLDMNSERAKDESEKRAELRAYSKITTDKQFNNVINNRLGIVLDATASKIQRTIEQKSLLESLGYDTLMIFVTSTLEHALKRNNERDRKVPNETVKESWELSMNNYEKMQTLFDNFITIQNVGTKMEFLGQLINGSEADKTIYHFLNNQPNKPEAQSWIEAQLELRKA